MSCWGDQDETAATMMLANVVEVAVAEDFACARLDGGKVYCWGSSPLGDGTTNDSTRPVHVADDAMQIVAAGAHACVRDRRGSVACWGDSSGGQAGTGATTLAPPDMILKPTQVELARPAVSLVAGRGHTCARSDRTFECWGWNGSDALRTGKHEHCSEDTGLFGSGTCTSRPETVSFVE